MSTSPNRQAVAVGLFVAAAVTIFGGAVLAVGNLNDTFTRKITVSARFPEVAGLKPGDNIWYSGVKVGVVKKIGFTPASEVEVQLAIDASAAAFIHADARARVGSDGLIGNRIVVLDGGTPEASALAEGDELTIAMNPSSEQIMATLQENNTNLLAITADLKGISQKIAAGEGTVGRLLADPALYDDLAAAAVSLRAASANAEELTASAELLAGGLNEEGTLIHDLVNDRTTYASLTTTVSSLQETGERVNQLVGELGAGMKDPNSAMGALTQDPGAGADLRSTLENLNRSSELLAEDLEALQHNFLLKPYFKKKAKAEARAQKNAEAP